MTDSLKEPVVDIRDATIRFGDFTAVERVTFSIHSGEVFGLIGPKGSGKTSLIQALCGLQPLAEGSATVLGKNVAVESESIRPHIGYLSQRFALFSDLTVQENLDFYSGIYGLSTAEARDRQNELVGLTDLKSYLDCRAGQLSRSWNQRLAIICALLHRPKLVFLEEPTAGVDSVTLRQVWEMLLTLAADGITLVVTTQSAEEAERCGRVGYLHLSKLLAIGTPSELLNLPAVTPEGTRRLEIIGRENTGLVARLRQQPGVREATVFGEAIHAVVDESYSTFELKRQGFKVREAEANLEDVFVTLARNASRV